MSEQVSQELAALYRAESTLLTRANALRVAASEAVVMGDQRQAAAMRGKARGLSEGAQQIAAVAAKIRALDANLPPTTDRPADGDLGEGEEG